MAPNSCVKYCGRGGPEGLHDLFKAVHVRKWPIASSLTSLLTHWLCPTFPQDWEPPTGPRGSLL